MGEAPGIGHGAQRVAEHELARVGQVDLVLDRRLEQRSGDRRRQRGAVDLDLEGVGAALRHRDLRPWRRRRPRSAGRAPGRRAG